MFKKVAFAVSAALVSSSAYALNPSDVGPSTVEIFMSGASAQDKGIAALFSQLCVDADNNNVADDLHVYKDIISATSPGKAHTAYFCTVDSTQVTGLSADVPVLFHKRSAGGSAQGVNPVIDEVAIEAMNINGSNCSLVSGDATSGEYHCTIADSDDTVMVVSDAGVSDVNPEMFVGGNTPAGNDPVNATEVSNKMVVRGAASLVFGIPVSTGLRNALQESQVADGSLPAGCDTGASTPGATRETEACMPNISKQLVASVMQGKINNWSEVRNSAGTPLSAFGTPANTIVRVCRRVNGSGTQAQMGAKFMNYPCTPGALAPLNARPSFFGSSEVVENSGSGDMSTCLNNFEASSLWAVGIQSTEKNADLADDYRFVKIDGYAPTLQNAATGHYMDAVENTFQWRIPAFNGPTGDKLAVIETIASNASQPGIVATLNTSFVHEWGQGGYMALAANGHAPSFPFSVASPVTTLSHFDGGTLDNCRVPTTVTGSGIAQ